MHTGEPRRPCDRLIPDDGPILLWPDAAGVGRWGLLLDVNVCPFPGCPERHVLVDGFLVADVRDEVALPPVRTLGRTLSTATRSESSPSTSTSTARRTPTS